jgi:transposase
MRFAGIDIAAESHVVAVVDEGGQSLGKPVTFQEDAHGYRGLREVLGTPQDLFVAMEATGHYWQNVFAFLTGEGFAVAVLNPRRTHHFAGEELARAKTDALDATAIARFAAQKRPPVTPLPDAVTQELRELVRLRDRLVQDFGDRLRQLHRLVDVGFPEFTQHVRRLDSQLATTILRQHPTAIAVRPASLKRLTNLRYDGRHKVGADLAHTLIDAAQTSVGGHHGPATHRHIRDVCEDLDCLRRRVQDLEGEITRTLAAHEIGTLLTTIDGIGPQTAARLISEVGNPAAFRSAAALAAYVGAVPGTRQSGKRRVLHAGLAPVGHSRLRAALWMPTLVAVRKNPWLRAFYERLRARGKLAKVALVAALRKLLIAIYTVAKSRRPFVPALTGMEVPTC